MRVNPRIRRHREQQGRPPKVRMSKLKPPARCKFCHAPYRNSTPIFAYYTCMARMDLETGVWERYDACYSREAASLRRIAKEKPHGQGDI